MFTKCCVKMLHNCFLFPLAVQNSGLLCQPDPEGTQAAVRPQLSTDTVLRCSSVRRATRVREGGWRQHRPRLHHVWSVCFCANSAHQNHRPSSRRRGLRQPSVRGTCPLMLKYHKWPLCNVTYHHRMAREKHSIVNFPVSLNCWFYNCVMFTEIIPIDN